jgi:ribosomal protein L44E
MVDRAPRLGDEIDDYCPRCRLLLNHDVTSLYDGKVAKSTCRTCHNTHDYRNAEVPPKRRSKKNDKKTLLDQVLSTMPKPPEPPPAPAAPSRKKRDLWADVERIKGQKKD